MDYITRMLLGLGSTGLLAVSSAQAVTLHDGTFDGGIHDAYFGPVQVEIVVQGGKVVSSTAVQYPDHRRTSVRINDYALPILEREAVKIQTAAVHTVSGATLTCDAYKASLSDALKNASK